MKIFLLSAYVPIQPHDVLQTRLHFISYSASRINRDWGLDARTGRSFVRRRLQLIGCNQCGLLLRKRDEPKGPSARFPSCDGRRTCICGARSSHLYLAGTLGGCCGGHLSGGVRLVLLIGSSLLGTYVVLGVFGSVTEYIRQYLSLWARPSRFGPIPRFRLPKSVWMR
jgi:hypothetical protein